MRRWWWLVGTGAGCVVAQPTPPQAPAPALVPAASGSVAANQARPAPEVAGGWGKFRPPLRPTIKASSEFSGWPASNAIDGDSETSWFSDRNDTASKGTKPWLELTLDRTVAVKGVRVMGNRDPKFPTHFSVLAAKIELLDDRGNTLFSQVTEGKPPRYDLDFRPPTPVASVRIVNLIIERDQGDLNSYGDTAVGEVLIDEAIDEVK